jgi:predicted MFS family arabinose efflux permease
MVLGVISGICSIKHMKKSPHPMIDLSLLKIPTFTTTLWAGLFFRIAIATVPFLIPLFLQIGLGMDPFKAGLIVLSIFLGNLAMKTVTTPLLNKYGFKLVMMVNGAMIVVTFLLSACIDENMQIGLMVAILFCGGLTRSLQFTSINTLSLADIPKEKISSASSVSGTAMQLSMALGIAIGSLTLTLVSLMHSGNIETPSVSDFRLALVLIAIFPIIGMIILNKLDSNAGISIRKLK